MIARMWRCYTTRENADALEAVIKLDILPRLEQIRGFMSGQLLRRDLLREVEFIGLTYFDSLESVRAAAGDDFGQPLMPESVHHLLLHFDKRASFYTISIDLKRS